MPEENIHKDEVFTNIINEYNLARDLIKRQNLIKRVQEITGRAVMVYVANFSHPGAAIHYQDIKPFEDMIKSCRSKGKEVDLIINSPGGVVEVTEKIAYMIRDNFDSFRVIIPNAAKSAATMLCLASDEIIMGYLAELGPIDPQIRLRDGRFIPAWSYIDGLKNIEKWIIKDNKPLQVYIPMISQIRPEIYDLCLKAIEGAKEFAEKWLSAFMLRNNKGWAKETAEKLAENKYPHGKVITPDDAKDELHLNVTKLDKDNELWKLVWELFCRAEFFIEQRKIVKLYETDTLSLNLK